MEVDYSIPGWGNEHKMNSLASIVEFYVRSNDDPIAVLEIGTLVGRSTVNINLNLRAKDRLTTVDMNQQGVSNNLLRSQNTTDKSIFGDLIKWNKLLDMSLLDARQVIIKEFFTDNIHFTFCGDGSDNFFKMNSNKFDVIYVDGDHYMPTVGNDLKNSYDNLSPGGLMIIDDFGSEWPDVQGAVLAVLNENLQASFFYSRQLGVAIIEKTRYDNHNTGKIIAKLTSEIKL